MQGSAGSDLPEPDETGLVPMGDHEVEFVRFAGGANLPTLVFLHEGLGSVAMWRDFPARVAAATNAPAVVYSRRGYGRSSPRAAAYDVDYMHLEARETLPHLLEHWGVERPILIGHSDGASIALIHAAEHPANVSGVAVMAPHVFVEDICIHAIKETRGAFATTDLESRLGRYHADAGHAFRGWNDIWLKPAFRDWNIEAMLPAITRPVLAIQGLGDPYGTMAQLDRIERAVQGPFRRLELPDCGHSPHRDKPAETLAALVEFCDRTANIGRA
ncbi:MAG: alpha/beta hydrolase [Rhodospirillaceae bacterium]